MRKFKSIAFTAIFLLSTFTLVTYTACTKDLCEDVSCQNGGTCTDGTCACPTGYSGKLCETKAVVDPCKDVVCLNGGTCVEGKCKCPDGFEGDSCQTVVVNFVKAWTAKDKDAVTGGEIDDYIAIITKGTTANQLNITGFSDDYFLEDVKAIFSGKIITVASQDPDSDGYRVEGTAMYNATDKSLNWTYTITSPTNQKANYTGVWK